MVANGNTILLSLREFVPTDHLSTTVLLIFYQVLGVINTEKYQNKATSNAVYRDKQIQSLNYEALFAISGHYFAGTLQ